MPRMRSERSTPALVSVRLVSTIESVSTVEPSGPTSWRCDRHRSLRTHLPEPKPFRHHYRLADQTRADRVNTGQSRYGGQKCWRDRNQKITSRLWVLTF